MHALQDHIGADSFETIEDVQVALELLEHDLPELQLDLVQNFNRVYTVITRQVRNAHKKHTFEQPDFLNRFDVRFAHYYFEALQAYVHHQALAPAWQRAFSAAEHQQASPFKVMILGVNAHVTNDIPQVLLDCQASSKHYRDYVYVNKIIGKALDEAIDSLASSKHPLHPQRPWLKPVYKPIMRLLVKVWRGASWRQYKRLLCKSSSVADLERYAGRKAVLLNRLPV